MWVCLWVFVLIIVIGSGLSSFGDEVIAQPSPIEPVSINGDQVVSEGDGSVCLNYETRTSSNTCEPDFELKPEPKPEKNFSSINDKPTDEDGEQEEISLLPNPEVEFIDDYMLKFGDGKPRNTIFFGGVVPFVAIPDGILANEDRFFNEDSFSVFFYLKRKF